MTKKLVLSHFSQRWAHFHDQEGGKCVEFHKAQEFMKVQFDFPVETAMAIPKCYCEIK